MKQLQTSDSETHYENVGHNRTGVSTSLQLLQAGATSTVVPFNAVFWHCWLGYRKCMQPKHLLLIPLPKFWRNKTEEMAITRFDWKTDIKVVVNGDVDQITRKFTRNTGWTKMHKLADCSGFAKQILRKCSESLKELISGCYF